MEVKRGIGLLGLPYDANSSYLQGPRLAPAQIREALLSDHWNMTTETGIDLDAYGWTDFGDLQLTNLSREAAFEEIQRGVGRILDSGTALVSLGGDHSVSFP